MRKIAFVCSEPCIAGGFNVIFRPAIELGARLHHRGNRVHGSPRRISGCPIAEMADHPSELTGLDHPRLPANPALRYRPAAPPIPLPANVSCSADCGTQPPAVRIFVHADLGHQVRAPETARSTAPAALAPEQAPGPGVAPRRVRALTIGLPRPMQCPQ
jgi:hypothetical protein